MRLAIVASSVEDFRAKLKIAKESLDSNSSHLHDVRGVYLVTEEMASEARLAFLFPGQGSQYPHMLRDVALHLPEIRQSLELANQILADKFPRNLSDYVFPPPAFDTAAEEEQMGALTDTVVAQPALGAIEMGLFRLLKRLGVKPDMTAGHSYGEYVSLCAAGAFEEEALLRISEIRGRLIKESVAESPGAMAAVRAEEKGVAEALQGMSEIWLANFNSPKQTIIAGKQEDLHRAIEVLKSAGLGAQPVPVACAFHTPLMEDACQQLASALSKMEFSTPQLKVFSNSLAESYPLEPHKIRATLAEHLVRPVQFVKEIEAMYDQGARIFLEVGPKSVLTGLVRKTLAGRDALTISMDVPGRNGLVQLLHALSQLAVHGVHTNLEMLFEGRAVRESSLAQLESGTDETSALSLKWLVNGTRVQPASLQHEPTKQTGESRRPTAPEGDERVTEAASSKRSPTTQQRREASSEKMPAQQQVRSESPEPHDRDPREDVLLRFQELMSQFLRNQRDVMTAYLGRGELEADTEPMQISSELLSGFPQDSEVSLRQSPYAGPLKSSEEASQRTEPGDRTESGVPAAPSPPHRPSSPEALTGAEEKNLEEQLLQLVSERTGYPEEMLGADMNLEADLGIDSIKRVEILSAFELQCTPAQQAKVQEVMDQLTRLKTLQEIVNLLNETFQSDQGDPGDSSPIERSPELEQDGSTNEAATVVPRFTLKVEDAPLGTTQRTNLTDKLFIITDDESEIAEELSRRLTRNGARPLLLCHHEKKVVLEGTTYRADLTKPKDVQRVLEAIGRQHGPIHAVVHLLPLKSAPEFDRLNSQDHQRLVRRDIKSLYNLAKGTEKDLRSAGKAAETQLIAATGMGGAFWQSTGNPYPPTHGGVAGFMKTVAVEWPEVRCKVIDLDPAEPASALGEKLWTEITCDDGRVQVGYLGERRVTIAPRAVDLEEHLSPQAERIRPASDWVFLLTGGARGITAEFASFLANNFQPTLLLVGLTPLPSVEESSATSGLTDPFELKAAIAASMRDSQEQVRPAQIEVIYGRLLREREIRQNIETLQRTGSKVEYHQVDVRDEGAFGGLIDEIYGRYGRLDGVIHGAGIIEDKLLRDKTPESFDRVLNTKAGSAFVLASKLRPESLKLLVFMSSLTAVFGNRGQSDYGAANGILNSLAHLLSSQWPGRVMAINWGPWDKRGMVSEEVRNQFKRRGIQIIPLEKGVEAMAREIDLGDRSEAIVILGDGPWSRQLGQPSALEVVSR
ncbi:MAG: SDR family NAD(P)-dependent oxidoreductase [Acidobacteriota bacterium]